MPKDKRHHEAAVMYNEELADFAEDLAARLPDSEPKKWCVAVSKQHRYHANKHKAALAMIDNQGEAVEELDSGGQIEDVPAEDEIIEPSQYNGDDKIVHRSAETGQFVTEDFADENPATTVEESVEVPAIVHEPVDSTTERAHQAEVKEESE